MSFTIYAKVPKVFQPMVLHSFSCGDFLKKRRGRRKGLVISPYEYHSVE
jgi:hypothetical protein